MPEVLAQPSRGPDATNPVRQLTAYELRNLVAHLVAAQELDTLRRLLVLETAEGRNAWYEAKAGEGELASYGLDVSAALRAVQEVPVNSSADSALVPRLGDQYRYALMLTSLNSLAAVVPPSLLAAMMLNHLISKADALSYARGATGAIQRAEALIQILPVLDESERQGTIEEIEREIEASAPEIALDDQSKRAELLASLVPYVDSAPRMRIIDDLIERLRDADANTYRRGAYRFTDPIFAVEHYLTPAQAERLFELAEHSADELIREGLLPAIGATANGELLDRVLTAVRKISFSGRRASVLVRIAPRLAREERAKALQEATEAALVEKNPDQLGKLLEGCPDSERSRVLKVMIEAALNTDDAGERAVALLKAWAYTGDAQKRGRLLDQALDAVKADDRIYPFRLVSLAQLGEQLPAPAKARLQSLLLAAAARPTGDGSTLAQLTDYLDEHEKEAVLAESFSMFRDSDPISQSFALKELAPRLPATMLREALRVVQVIRDDGNQRDALAALSPYLLRSAAGTEVAEVIAAAHAVRHGPIVRDILIALAGQVAGEERASVLAEALDLNITESVSKGPTFLAPSLDYAGAADVRPVWERAVRIASDIPDPADRARALTALGACVSPDLPPGTSQTAPGPREVLSEALRAAREIQDMATRAEALVRLGPHLPEAERSRALNEAAAVAWQLIRKWRQNRRRYGDLAIGMPVDTLAVVAAGIEPREGRAIANVVLEFVRLLSDHYVKSQVYALAIVGTCFPEPHRSQIRREAAMAARKHSLEGTLAALAPVLPEPDRSAALSDALPQARKNDGYDIWSSIVAGLGSMPETAAYQILRNPPGNLATLPRKNLLAEITHTAPIIFALGGRPAIADIADAVRQTAHWWP